LIDFMKTNDMLRRNDEGKATANSDGKKSTEGL
jgi:hypothetical protein